MLREVDSMVATSHESEKVAFALQTDLQVAVPCTPPMTRMLREVDSMVATSHESEKVAFALQTDLQVAVPCTPPMTRILKEVDCMMATSHESEKVAFALQTDIQVAAAGAQSRNTVIVNNKPMLPSPPPTPSPLKLDDAAGPAVVVVRAVETET